MHRVPYVRRFLVGAAVLAIVAPTAAMADVTSLAGALTGSATDRLQGADAGRTMTATDADATLRAGVGSVDVTWHVGASSGQYAGVGPGPVVGQPDDGGYDPSVHSTTSRPSYGIESRAWARALLVEGVNGERWALLTNDLYIPQDLLNTRVATILEDHDRRVQAGLVDGPLTGISVDNLSITTSHSHASPFYSSTAWGVWAFQDVFDIRFFEFIAQRMADAVIEAAAGMRPARMGAASAPMTITKRNPEGPSISDHGVPAAYPYSDNDPTFTVVRFDDLSDPDEPRLLADWIVFGRHPEGLDGNDLHSGEFTINLWRILDREVGGLSLFSQNDVGTSEVTRNALAHDPVARQEWDSNSYNQRERLARRYADLTKALLDDVAVVTDGGEASVATDVVAARSDVPVGVHDLDFAPPSYRLLPTVSNCRAEEAAEGNPGVPIVGLPNCGYFLGSVEDNNPLPTGATYEDLQTAGVPLPDNIGGPSYTGLQETLQVHLQAVRLGGVGVTLCPCEQFTDMSRNVRSRLNGVDGDMYFGWDWTANHEHHPDWRPGVIYDGRGVGERDTNGYLHGPVTLPDEDGEHWCTQAGGDGGDWTCKDPRDPSRTLDPISDLEFRMWKARIYNDARGWDEYLGDDDATPNALEAEAEPDDPDQVWGNWIHEELTPYAYEMVVPVSMANDYWGYIPPYSEFQNRDYYRKALAGLGPHSADFLVTRMSRMLAELNGAPNDLVELGPKDLAYAWDAENQRARAELIGRIARTAMPAYEAQLPPDGGTPTITDQPQDITRFQAAEVTWVGGSNYTDVPHAEVERCLQTTEEACAAADATWVPFGDGFGEVQVLADFPDASELPHYRTGRYEWHWRAFFEAYDSDIVRTDANGKVHAGTDGRGSQAPDGIYRFTIEGCHRGLEPDVEPNDPDGPCSAYDASGRVDPYHLVSEPFRVGPWEGITVEDPQVSGDWSTMTFDVGPTFEYPLTASNATYAEFTSDNGRLGGGSVEYSSGIYAYDDGDAVDYPHALDSPFPYIRSRDDASCLTDGCGDLRSYAAGPGDDELFCFQCHFEAWAETGAVDEVTVTVVRARGNRTEQVRATFDPETGTWSAQVDLRPGDEAFVPAAGITDRFGEINGEASATVRRPLGTADVPGRRATD